MRSMLNHVWARVALALVAVVVLGTATAVYYLFGVAGRSPTLIIAAPTLVASKNGAIFTIDPSASQASFTMSEVLLGQPNTVVGKTTHVTGQIMVDRQNPANSKIGEIQIDLSTLVTDNDFRNLALKNRILETSVAGNQYATFVATSISGLPTSTTDMALGRALTFQVTGTLSIHHVTRIETFTVQVDVESNTTLKGHAQATVRYTDFHIALPNVPSVTDVSDTVLLALDFTAHT